MATELGSAYISVGLGTNTLTGDIKKAFGSAGDAGSAAGKSAGGGFASGFKGLAGPAIAAIGAIGLGGFIAEAARASDATDKFKSTLNFAGLDTSAIDAATKAAKGYADQTVYDLPTIQQTMAQLASNGVKNYTDITKAAGNLNAVAGGNAETFKSVSRSLTQSAGAGKLMTEDWNMLADAIPGASGVLQKSMKEAGAYTGNFKDAMAAGEITADEFQAAITKLGNDPVAVEAAKSVTTFEGAIGNLQATINSGLVGALDAMKPALTGAISGLASGIGVINGAIGSMFELFKTGDYTGAIGKALGVDESSKIIGAILEIRGGFFALVAAFQAGGNDVTSNGFAGVMERIGLAAREITGGVIAMFAAFQAGGSDVTSSGFPGFMERIGLAAREVTGGVIAMFAAFAAGGNDVTSSGFAGFMETLGLQARNLFDALGPQVAALVPQLFALFQALSPTSLIFQALLPVLPQIAAAFGSVIAAVLPLVLSLTSQLLPIITQLVSAVLPPLIDIFMNVVTAIAPLVTMLAGLLIPIIQALMPVVVTVFGVIANVITSVMQIIQGVIQVVTGLISGNWSQVWEGIQNIFGGIWDTIVALIGAAIAIVWSVIQSGLNLVFGFIGGVLGKIGKVFADTWNNVTKGISDFIGGIGKFFEGIPKVLGDALSGAGQWLYGAGKNIVEGLFNGIKSLAGTIGNFFLGLLPGWIVEPFKIALGIHSPSRVFRGLGVNIGEGLLLGVDDMHGKIDSAMGGLVTVPSIPSVTGFGASSYSSYARSAPGGSTFNIYETDDPIATAHAVARRQAALTS